MIGHHSKQTWRRRWPLLGVLLIGLFLGHDALMAFEAMAAPRMVAAASHHAARSLTIEAVATAPHDSAPAPKHPENCSVGLSALPRSGHDASVDQALSAVDHITASSAPPPGYVAAFAWQEPHRPPGRLRALVQVYRI
jgi:hypothetical protein